MDRVSVQGLGTIVAFFLRVISLDFWKKVCNEKVHVIKDAFG